jgi:hypothetical protein
MHYRTQINRVGPNISIPRLPSRFMDFRDVARLRNNMLTGAYTIIFYEYHTHFLLI